MAESAWASLLLNAAFNTSRGPSFQIGILTLAAPAACAVLLATALPPAPSRRRRWLRAALLGVGVVAGAMLSAGVMAELARSGSFWTVASHPWAASGHRAAVLAGTAWFLSVLAWARGTWLGSAPPSFTHASRSVGLGAIAFIGIFAGRADTHAPAFRAATGSAGWLLFLAFPCAAGTLALIHQGELQEEVSPGARSGPGPVWLSVLAVPTLATALVALIVAVAIGPAAPVVGHGAARAGKALWWVVAAVATALWRLFPQTRARGSTAERGRLPFATLPRAHALAARGAVPLALEVVLAVVAFVVVVLLAVVVGRALRPLGRRRGRSPTRPADGETDSVFSWGHLASQLWRVLMRPFTRRRRRHPAAVPAAPDAGPGEVGSETVRLAYRRVLAAAAAGGWPRSVSETTRELERRLVGGPVADEAGALAELTALYDSVRYGDRPSGPADGATAATRAEAIGRALETAQGRRPTMSPSS